jgi:hypothetical protein
MPVEYLTPAIEDRAVEILTLLADRGQHRAPSLPGLIIAATAELAGLTVLHLDKDFDLIAEITGQPMERPKMHRPGTARSGPAAGPLPDRPGRPDTARSDPAAYRPRSARPLRSLTLGPRGRYDGGARSYAGRTW